MTLNKTLRRRLPSVWASDHRLHLLGLTIAACGLYLVRFISAPQLGVTGDDARYMVLAESFLRGMPYRVISFPQAPLETIWPPGYPLFVLAPAGFISGLNYDVMRGMSIVLTGATVPLVYALVKPHLPDERSTLMVTTLYALNPALAGFAGVAMSEASFMFFVVLTLALTQRWYGQVHVPRYALLALGLLLAATTLVRYQGLAFAAATGFWLVLVRRPGYALALWAIFALLALPFVAFLRANAATSPDSLFAVQMIQTQVATLWDRLPTALWNYAVAVPQTMLPATGPRAFESADSIGLGWLINGLHVALFLAVGFMMLRGAVKRELPAIALGAFFGLTLLVDNQAGASRNESRYSAMMAPFFYLYFYRALRSIATMLRVRELNVARSTALVCSIVLVLLVARNVQTIRTPFAIVDLSIGATWVQANTPSDAIFATNDPVERYIYLRRRTIQLTPVVFDSLLRQESDPFVVDYVLIAPELRDANAIPNQLLKLDEEDLTRYLPSMNAQQQQFQLVWKNEATDTSIYRIDTKTFQTSTP